MLRLLAFRITQQVKDYSDVDVVNMGYWPSLFSQDGLDVDVDVFMDLDFVSVHKHAKKDANIQPSWSNKLGQ